MIQFFYQNVVEKTSSDDNGLDASSDLRIVVASLVHEHSDGHTPAHRGSTTGGA
jgi:hypothetical protein